MSSASLSNYETERYNALASVESSHRRRLEEEARFERLHSEACNLVRGTRLADDLGLFLLHRHWQCSDGNIMCESSGTWRDRAALITRSVHMTGEEYPTRWMVAESGDVYALEFSDDPVARPAVAGMVQHLALICDLMRTLHDSGLGDIIGISVLRHDFLNGSEEGERLIEENFDGLSVVVVRKPTPDEEGVLIPTTWFLQTPAGCKPACKCQPYSINECRHHTKVHTYKVCVPACVRIGPPTTEETTR